MRNLDMELLRALVTIADCGGFSSAATRLGRTQSAVSLQIKRLEEQVGHALLDRSQGRVAGPTEEGRVLIDYGRRILRLNDEAYSCFAQPGMSGRLRVGLPEELMESVFPEVLAAFHQAYPRVELQLRCDLSLRLAAALDAGELDLALVKRIETAAKGTESRRATRDRVLRHEPLVWLAGEKGEAARRRPLPLAVFHEGCVFRTAALAALARARIAWQPVFVGNSYTALRHAVAAGMALAPLPLSLALPGMRPIRDDLPPLPRAELAARFAPGEPSAIATRLLETLEQRLWRPDAPGDPSTRRNPGAAPA